MGLMGSWSSARGLMGDVATGLREPKESGIERGF